MAYYALKSIISALLVVGISEIAKRFTGLAALMAAIWRCSQRRAALRCQSRHEGLGEECRTIGAFDHLPIP